MIVRFLAPFCLVSSALVAALSLALPAVPLGLVSRATVALAIALLALVIARSIRLNGRLVFDPPLLMVLVFFVWHFSFWVVDAIGLSSSYRVSAYTRFSADATQLALLLSLAAFLALVGGVLLGTGRGAWRPVPTARASTLAPYAVVVAGAALMIVYFAIWGWRLIGHYENLFLKDDPPRRLFNLGVVLVLPSAAVLMHYDQSAKRRLMVLAATVPPALVVAAAIGSRWVLFSAVLLALGAISMRGTRIGYLRPAMAGLGLVLVSTAIKELRRDVNAIGSLPTLLFNRDTNPVLEFIEEVGQAFIAVAGTIDMRTGGYLLLWGQSFADAALSAVPSLPQLLDVKVVRPAQDLASTYFEREYETEGHTIGYSIVAELYANFGVPGVIIGLAGGGYSFGRLYRRYLVSGTYASLFIVYAVLSFALFGVRNDMFTWLRAAVWASVLFGLIGWQLDRHAARSAARSGRRAIDAASSQSNVDTTVHTSIGTFRT